MALYEIGKGTYELPDNLDPEQLKNVAQQVYDKYEATRQTDLGYGVDLLQKNIGYGIEAIGDFAGVDAIKDFGTAQAQRNEQSIEEGRWSPDQAGSFLDQKGAGNKLKWLGENMVTQGPNSGVALAGALAAMATAPFSVPAALVLGAGTTGVSLLQATGEAASETKDKTGSYDSAYAVGTGALVALLDKIGAGKVIPKDRLMKMTGDELVKELSEKGFTDAAQEVTKAINKAAATEGVTEIAQESAIVAQSAAQGGQYTGEELLDRGVDSFVLGGSMGGTIRGGTEILAQATSGSQEQKFDAMEESLEPIIQRGFNQGDEKGEADYNRAVQIMDSINKAREGDTEAAKESLKFIDTSAANASFAQRLQKLIEGGYKGGEGTIPFDVQDVDRDSTTGARALIDAAHIDIAEGIRQKFSLLKDQFKVDTKKLESLQNLEAKIEASGALRHSKNKTKASLPADNFNAVAKLVGNTKEGQELLNLMRESQVLTEVHNNDYVGGLSKYTDQLNPFGTNTGYSSAREVATVARAVATGAGYLTGGLPALAAQGAVVAGGRKLGKGSRSTVANFIANNAGGQPMTTDPSPPLPSVVANAQQSIKDAELAAETRRQQQEQARVDREQQQAQAQAEREAANRQLGQQGAPAVPTSPQGTLESATGLDKNTVARAMRILESLPSTPAALRRAIEAYRPSIDTGGRVADLSMLIRAINNLAEQNPDVITRTAPPNTGAVEQFAQVQERQQYQESANYARGVEANQKFVSDLQESVNNDTTLDPVAKAKIQTYLYDLSLNLGSDPVGKIESVVNDAAQSLTPEQMQTYIAPYAERVMRQQGRKPVQNEVIEDRRPPMSVSLYQDPDQLWSVPEQAYDSADTSINSGKLPAGTTRMIKDGVFQEGQTVVDIGGGRFDNAVEAVGKTGATVVVYDPFNRTPEHNQEVVSQVANGGADISMAHNVLNVIQEPENMDRVIRQAKNAIPIGGKAYFSVYEGTGKGKGFPTTKGWQRNEKTVDYVPRIEAIFGEGNVERKGKLIIATNEGTGVRSRLTDGNIGRSLQRAQNNVIADRPAPSPLVDENPSGRTISIKGQTPNEGNKHGLMPHLRVSTNYKGDAKKPLVLQATNEKNAQGQMDNIDKILGKHKNPAKSLASWKKMMSFALSSDDIPVPPYNFINNSKTKADVKMLKGLSEQQLADANIGFENAKQFRDLYTSGQVTPADTGKLFLWSFLSRGITPYVQEAMFIDTFNGIDKFISDAALGTFNIDDYLAWADTNAPKGSGLPAAGAKANLNSFGKDFLTKMSKDVGDGRSKLEYLHDLMSDPNSTGKQIRREFAKIGEGVGIDNKVVSFTLLVAGYDDIMVLDRVQFKNLWDDGRFSDVNLYDGYKEQNQDGKSMVVTGSMLGGIGDGARGILVYEALENSLQTRVDSIYKELGRPDDASIGRYHWETWVASSNQEASHGSLDAILGALKGDQNALADVTVKQGKLNQFAYGTRYGRDAKGNPFFLYEVPDHGSYIMDAENYGNFIANIKKRKYDIIPSGFKVSEMPETGALPWYSRPEVNKANLDKLAKQHGAELTYDNTIRQDDAENVSDQTVSNRDTADRSQVGGIEGTQTPILAEPSLRPTDFGLLPEYDENKPIKEIMLEPQKASMQKARSIITEISDEKPIRDMETLTLLARAFNTDIVYVANQEQLDQVYKDYGLHEQGYRTGRYSGNSNAFFIPLTTLDPVYDDAGGFQYHERAHGKAGVCVVKTGNRFSSEGMVRSAFHEVAHAITLVNPQQGTVAVDLSDYNLKNPINSRSVDEYYYSNAFISDFYNAITGKDRKLKKKLK